MQEPDPVRIINRFEEQWNAVRDILHKHWGILTSTSGLANIVGPTSKMLARRAKNLGDTLIRSEFTKTTDTSWLSQYPRSKGVFPCGHCQVCPHADRTATFYDSQNAQRFQIRDLINCATTRVIYMLTCPCDKIYIGKPNVS